MPHHIPVQRFAESLRGINFPCSKQDLVNHCRMQGCADEVCRALQDLPDRTYNSMSDVMEGVGRIE